VLVKRDRQLALVIKPDAVGSAEVQELCKLLNLHPGLLRYNVVVGRAEEAFSPVAPPLSDTIHLLPRSTVQAMFYLSHGVVVPPEHLACGLVRAYLISASDTFSTRSACSPLLRRLPQRGQ
jgi:hypothetical protein